MSHEAQERRIEMKYYLVNSQLLKQRQTDGYLAAMLASAYLHKWRHQKGQKLDWGTT